MSVVWSEAVWLWPAVYCFIALALLLLAAYLTQRGMPLSLRIACILLKLLGFASLLVILLDPQLLQTSAKPGANLFIVLADTSASLRIKDQAEGRTRGQTLSDIARDKTWIDSLEAQFTTFRFSFDSRVRPRESFDTLTFDGEQTSLGAALDQLGHRYSDRPLAGILVLTDGCATDSLAAATQNKSLPPVYPVLVQGAKTLSDLAIEKVQVRSVVFEDAPILIDASVRARGLNGVSCEIRLVDLDGNVVAEETRRSISDDELFSIRFTPRPNESKVAFYRVEVVPPAGREDAIAENNSWLVAANRDTGPYRILYMAGRPNWEHKFLQRSLSADPSLKMVSLVRVARRQAKLDWRSRGATVNPLFQAFQPTEEKEKFDEPVFVRLQVSSGNELRGGVPKTADEMFPYDAIIIDDAESDLFTTDQMRLLHDYVANRGGSLLMIGGRDSLEDGHYEKTPLGEILPVYLRKPATPPPGGEFRFRLTREGMLQPWLRLKAHEQEEIDFLDTMPAFRVLNEISGIKPGGMVLAEAEDASGRRRPALAVQRFGNGRAGAFMFGDLWRWGMQDETSRANLEKTWRQMIRGLLADVPKRVTLEAVPDPASPDQATLVKVRVVGKNFLPSSNPNIQLRIQSPDGKWTTAEAKPGEDPAEWIARITTTSAGPWKAETVVTDPEDGFTTQLSTGWTRNPASEEFRQIEPDLAAVQALARATGGEMVEVSGLRAWAERLQKKSFPVMETRTTPLWQNALFLALALIFFASEWALRRWKGFP